MAQFDQTGCPCGIHRTCVCGSFDENNNPKAIHYGRIDLDKDSPMHSESLQSQITKWGQETFEEPGILALAVRGNKEMAELISEIINNGPNGDNIGEECADVAFFLLQICGLQGFDLMEEVAKKFEKNKARSWGKNKDGSFQHVD